MSTPPASAYIRILEKIKEAQKVLADLRNEAKALQIELIDYFNQTEEEGIRIDADTIITLEQKATKVPKKKTAYREFLTDLCAKQGLSNVDLVDEIISGKTETTVQQARIRLIKSKKNKKDDD